MAEFSNPSRYSIIREKNKREIIMLRGQGCVWRRCRFCDQHLDQNANTEENYTLNETQLNKVTGLYKKLEVINFGSFTDLDAETIRKIKSTCQEKQITQLHFECHWIHRNKVPQVTSLIVHAITQRFYVWLYHTDGGLSPKPATIPKRNSSGCETMALLQQASS